jgi:phosphoribosylformylglycinamidine (FGAM) synthase-like amidotransferase family enzyme
MSEIEFQDKELKKTLRALSNNLKYVKNGEKKFVALMSSVVYADIMDHFKKEQGEDGAWQHWSFWYELQLARMGRQGNKILQFNGKLRNNFKPTDVKMTSQGITWFNDAKTKSGFPYAFAHNEGGGKLPKRDFMWASDNAIEKMADNMLGFILEEGLNG